MTTNNKKITIGEKLRRYEAMQAARSKGGKAKFANMTPEEQKAYIQMMIDRRLAKKKEREQDEQEA